MTPEKKQEGRLAFLGALAGGLAHEIKNPLSTISMNLQLLREDWEDAETDRERRTVRKIDVLAREVKRLEAILDDFLRFAGGHKLQRERMALKTLVEDTLEFLGPNFVEAGVDVRVVLEDDVPPVEIDRDAMKQVLLNLTLNAMQAMPDGGELLVRVMVAEDGDAILELTDTGEGIPPDLLHQVWHVYYSRRKTGTGMGLPTARRIVEEHDGTIAVFSEEGKGTRFTIALPPAPAEDPE